MRRLRILLAALLIALATPASAHSSLQDIVRRAAHHAGISERLALGLVQVESGFRPRVVSRERAIGLLQIQPTTARAIGCRGSLYEPVANAECGARYLRVLLDRTRGNVAQALAYYNMGPAGCRRNPRPGYRYAARVLAAARSF